MRRWLDDCTTTHECCLPNIPPPRLPTRVLDLRGGFPDHDSVKLVQTSNGSTGAYCALSHCWGPKDKQPIKTLQSNLNKHISGISLSSLPRTFREAVILTRGLGIDYLWIDSLCIIQDSEADWRSEAASMGTLYQRATLVIVAAGSHDSSGGLFTCERPQKTALQLPYTSDGNCNRGTFNMALRSPTMVPWGGGPSKVLPSGGPLRERAWAFQEWYLARRKVFFMPGGLTWHCAESEHDEPGSATDLELYETMSWLDLVEIYSGKKVTFPSDRLIALQGVANEEGRRREDRFLSEGIWETGIPQQLLWFRGSILNQDNNSLPSWSWASTAGSKYWLASLLRTRHSDPLDHSCVVIQMIGQGNLSVSGDLVNVAREELDNCCVETFAAYKWCDREDKYREELEAGYEIYNEDWEGLEGRAGFAERYLGFIFPGYAYDTPESKVERLQSDDGILGFAVMDQDQEAPAEFLSSTASGWGNLYCCVLGKAVNNEYDPA